MTRAAPSSDPRGDTPGSPRSALLGHAGEAAARELAARADLDDVLDDLLRRAHAAWPTLKLADDAFLRYIGERVALSPEPVAALVGLHAQDLFLACACASGDGEAIRQLESRHMRDARLAVARTEPSKSAQDEVMQQLREKLFVADGANAPRISQYSGRGPLAGWLRMAAVRTALSLKRGQRRHGEAASEERVLEMAARELDPELAQIKATYQVEFKAAFQSALTALTPRERNVLRLHFIDGLNIDEVGAVYRVHRSTVARWIVRAKEQLLEDTRRLMTERLALSDSQFDSLMGLVRSQLDVSLIRFLDEQG